MSYKFKSRNYDRNRGAKSRAELPPADSIVGVRIMPAKVEGQEWAGTRERKSAAGNDMLQVHAIVLEGFPGEGAWLLDYITYGNQYTDQNIGQLIDALGFDLSVDGYNLTPAQLVGRCGYVRIKHETFNGETRAKINYWITPLAYEKMGLKPFASAEAGAEPQENDQQGGGDDAADEIPF